MGSQSYRTVAHPLLERNIIMHFKALVIVQMPPVEEDPQENAEVLQAIELLQDQKKEQAKNIMAEITL